MPDLREGGATSESGNLREGAGIPLCAAQLSMLATLIGAAAGTLFDDCVTTARDTGGGVSFASCGNLTAAVGRIDWGQVLGGVTTPGSTPTPSSSSGSMIGRCRTRTRRRS